MKYLIELFFGIYLVYSLFIFLGGPAFVCRINTKVYTKLLPQYYVVHSCDVQTKRTFIRLEQVKVKFGGVGGGRGLHKHPGLCLPLLVNFLGDSWNHSSP